MSASSSAVRSPVRSWIPKERRAESRRKEPAERRLDAHVDRHAPDSGVFGAPAFASSDSGIVRQILQPLRYLDRRILSAALAIQQFRRKFVYAGE